MSVKIDSEVTLLGVVASLTDTLDSLVHLLATHYQPTERELELWRITAQENRELVNKFAEAMARRDVGFAEEIHGIVQEYQAKVVEIIEVADEVKDEDD